MVVMLDVLLLIEGLLLDDADVLVGTGRPDRLLTEEVAELLVCNEVVIADELVRLALPVRLVELDGVLCFALDDSVELARLVTAEDNVLAELTGLELVRLLCLELDEPAELV